MIEKKMVKPVRNRETDLELQQLEEGELSAVRGGAGASVSVDTTFYPAGYPTTLGVGVAGYPVFAGGGPPVAPGSTQALYSNNAVASGTQGLLNKIAFGLL